MFYKPNYFKMRSTTWKDAADRMTVTRRLHVKRRTVERRRLRCFVIYMIQKILVSQTHFIDFQASLILKQHDILHNIWKDFLILLTKLHDFLDNFKKHSHKVLNFGIFCFFTSPSSQQMIFININTTTRKSQTITCTWCVCMGSWLTVPVDR